MKKICKILCVFVLLILCGCQTTVEQRNIEKLEKAAEEYVNGGDYWDSVEKDIHEVDPDCVYWTPKGKCFHSVKDCVALSRSVVIEHGTLKEAIASGHSDPCSKCVGGD